jgi:hypothetical protein
MRLERLELEHPTQASRVALNLYEVAPAANPPGIDTPSENGGFLVTEERIGTTTVISSLGFFETREAAQERFQRRAEELRLQRYRDAAPAA